MVAIFELLRLLLRKEITKLDEVRLEIIMEFSDENLIELVEKCPNLYAKSHPDYKDKNKAQNSWISIAQKLNVQATDCQYRWGQLRDRFTRERRYLKAGLPSGSGSNQPTPSALYKSLLFLEPHVQTRRTRRNIKRNISPPEDDSFCYETLETNDPDTIEYLKTLENKENIIEVKNSEGHSVAKMRPLHENGNTEHQKNSSFPTDGGEKANKTGKAEVSADAALQEASEALPSVKELCKSADKCDDVAYYFCMTTYSQMKTMSTKKKKLLVAESIPLCWNSNLILSKIYYSLCFVI